MKARSVQRRQRHLWKRRCGTGEEQFRVLDVKWMQFEVRRVDVGVSPEASGQLVASFQTVLSPVDLLQENIAASSVGGTDR